jgi:hypothetical protein
MLAGLAAGASALLTSCGTVIYPDRSYQKERGAIAPSIVLLDAIGLFFFIVPGLVAFAVDFTTGAIYFPAEHEPGERERMIFDQYDAETKLDRKEIERIVARKTGKQIDLAGDDVRVMELQDLGQFWPAHAKLSEYTMLAAR